MKRLQQLIRSFPIQLVLLAAMTRWFSRQFLALLGAWSGIPTVHLHVPPDGYLDFGIGPVGRADPDVASDDVRTLPREGLRRGAPQASSGAGDQHGPGLRVTLEILTAGRQDLRSAGPRAAA